MQGGEDAGGAEQARRVRVVAAGVHRAVGLGGEIEPGGLADRQRVHIGAQRDGGAGAPADELGDEPRLGDAGADGQAERAELGFHQRPGLVFAERELGAAVDLAAEADDLGKGVVGEGADAVEHEQAAGGR